MEPDAKPQERPGRRPRRAVRYPAYNLADSVEVAKRITEDGGGVASRDRLAAFLSYSTTNSGAFLGRIAAARLFGLITTQGLDFVITPLAQKILMPVYPEQTRQALVEAFFNVPLFKEIYAEYNGKPIPPDFGMKNFLRSRHSLNVRQADESYRALIESADVAGFFATRNARTHLIIPQVGQVARQASPSGDEPNNDVELQPTVGGSGGAGSGGIPPQRPVNASSHVADMRSVKAAYVNALIDVLREKSKGGELDSDLMSRIERLISEADAAPSRTDAGT